MNLFKQNSNSILQFRVYVMIFLLLPVLVCCKSKNQSSSSVNTLSKKEKQEGWILLFDGETFNGWRGLGLDKAPDGWITEEGTIKIEPKENWPRQADGQPILGADLITVETFENFELSWDWKLKKGGNSGIKYNVSEGNVFCWSMSDPPMASALGILDIAEMGDDSRTFACVRIHANTHNRAALQFRTLIW